MTIGSVQKTLKQGNNFLISVQNVHSELEKIHNTPKKKIQISKFLGIFLNNYINFNHLHPLKFFFIIVKTLEFYGVQQ